jgi:salicylate hydroxylase
LSSHDNIPAAFKAYITERAQRNGRVQREARFNGQIYHMNAPLSWARNFKLRNTSPASFAQRYEWLYGFKV